MTAWGWAGSGRKRCRCLLTAIIASGRRLSITRSYENTLYTLSMRRERRIRNCNSRRCGGRLRQKTGKWRGTSGAFKNSFMIDQSIKWLAACREEDIPAEGGACVLLEGEQIAIFRFARRAEWYATQNLCPHRHQMSLSRGMTGS